MRRTFAALLAVTALTLGACSADDAPEAQPPTLGLEDLRPRTAEPTPCFPSSDASSYVGQRTTICGPVSGATYRSDVRGEPTFINFDRPFPDHTFTALVWGEDRGSFSPPPEQQFDAGRHVCVTGLVESHDGIPQIVVRAPSQIQVC